MKPEDPNINTWVEPELEARLVAHLLGEASEFEASELERLIQENPEMAVLQRRLEAVHGLVSEATSVGPDDDWKLAPERRQQLLKTLRDTPQPEESMPVVDTRSRRPSTKMAWLVRSTVAAAVLILATLLTFPWLRQRQPTIGFASDSRSGSGLESEGVSAASSYATDLAQAPHPVEFDGFVHYEPNTGAGQLADASTPDSVELQLGSPVARYDTNPDQKLAEETTAERPSVQWDFQALENLSTSQRSNEQITEAYAEPTASPSSKGMELADAESYSAIKRKASTFTAPESMEGLERNRFAYGLDGAVTEDPFEADSGAVVDERLSESLFGNNPPETDDFSIAPAEIKNEEAKFVEVQNESEPSWGAIDAVTPSDTTSRQKTLSDAINIQGTSGPQHEQRDTLAFAETTPRGISDPFFDQGRDDPAPQGQFQQSQTRTTRRAGDPKGKTTSRWFGRSEDNLDLASPEKPQMAAKKAPLSTAPSSGDLPELAQAAQPPVIPADDVAELDADSQGGMAGGGADGLNRLSTVAKEKQENVVEEARLKMLDLAERYRVIDLSALENAGETALGDVAKAETAVAQIKEELESLSDLDGDALASATRDELKAKLGYAENARLLENDLKQRSKDDLGIETKQVSEYSEASKAYEKALQDAKQLEQEERQQALQRQADFAEKHTSQEPFSTFSLHVSDVAFKLAKAALLENNSTPDPAKVRVEEFVNAFDYGDPAPSQAEKVSSRTEQAAHPFQQQRNLLRVTMRTAELGRSASQPLRLTLLLDTSGSMERQDRKDAVLRAMQVLTSQLAPTDSVTLIGFARTPRLIVDRLTGEALNSLPDLVRQTPAEGGTNLEEALLLATEASLRQFEAAGQNRVVLITDGAANLGDAEPETLKHLVIALRQQGVAFDACGVGAEGLNDAVLEALSRQGDGRYYFLDKPEDADAGFARQLAGALRPAARNVKVQVHFNPNRVGHYHLMGFEKHRLKKEDFRNDQVDAAEMAAAEAGVALYAIEPLADGQGEIGEVSVRFQDTSTGLMIERTWTIPYRPDAPALSEASPSLQLASAAAFLAEKLRHSPVGESVRLEELTPILTNVRQCYDADARVKDLIAMIEKARSL